MSEPERPREDASAFADDQVDWWLQDLVELANSGPFDGVTLTLQMGGILVSGTLTSRTKYFEEGMTQSKLSPFSSSPEDRTWILENFGSEADKKSQEALALAGTPLRTWYIHLRNARVFHPSGGSIPKNEGVWWRGKITAVDGFFFGSLSIETDLPTQS